MAKTTISLTASHIETEHRIDLLKLMIESLIIHGIRDIYISISFDLLKSKLKGVLESLFQNFESKYGSRCGCGSGVKIHRFYHEEPVMLQFEHLDFLSSLLSSSPLPFGCSGCSGDTHVLFMDDDDLLLDNPEILPDSNGIIGQVYHNQWKGFEEYPPFKRASQIHFHKLFISEDFGGSILKLNILLKYLAEKEHKFTVLEDQEFIDWIEKNYRTDTTIDPYVYYRKWQPSSEEIFVCAWRRNLGGIYLES